MKHSLLFGLGFVVLVSGWGCRNQTAKPSINLATAPTPVALNQDTPASEFQSVIDRCEAVRKDVKDSQPIEWMPIFQGELSEGDEGRSVAFKRGVIDWRAEIKPSESDGEASVIIFRDGLSAIESPNEGQGFSIGFVDNDQENLVFLLRTGDSDWAETLVYSAKTEKLTAVEGVASSVKTGITFSSVPNSSIQSFTWTTLFNSNNQDWQCRTDTPISPWEPLQFRSKTGKVEAIGTDDEFTAYACRETGECLIRFQNEVAWVDVGTVPELFGP